MNNGDDVVVISKGGQLVRMPAATIRECGRGSQGVRVASLNDGDQVIAAARVLESEKGDDAGAIPPAVIPEDEGGTVES
jgi:DNA gyrase subunit A